MARKEVPSGQRFACDRIGCNKHYSRPDHLLRHKLNHDRERILACDQCERTFVRQDLLTRHLERHALRGKTLGRWSSKRKRDGESAGSSEGQERDEGDMTDRSEDRHSYQGYSASLPSTSNLMHPTESHFGDTFRYAPPPPPAPPPSHYPPAPPPSHYPPAPPPSHYPESGGLPINGLLQESNLDAMGSHNAFQMAPMVEHHSAFDRSDHIPYNIPGYAPWQKPFASTEVSPLRPFEQLAPDLIAPVSAPGAAPAPALLESSVPGSSHFTFSNPQTGDYIADYDWLFDGANPLLSSSKGAEEMYSETSTTKANTERTTTQAEEEENEDEGEDGHKEGDNRMGGEAGALHDLAFFAILQRDIPDEPAFDVDQTVHSRLLHFLSSVQELPTSPLFTPSALRCYLHLFFTKLNTIYPLIHRPTFSAKVADPMLLSAMVVCGAHFADEGAHFLAERIGRKLWGAFISFEDFRPARATLALLQAMLLTELFGKTMGTRPQHETAHLFHNFIVTLARRNAVFTPSKVKLPSTSEERWRAWSREEEKKRIALFSFLLDAQHAIVFRHIPALSSFQIHLQLPCEERLWEARSSQEWRMECGKRTLEMPSFIAALKASLSPEPSEKVIEDSFQQFVLLHGLMSVAYDLQWKQQTLLAAPETSESISNWKDTIKASYESCKKRLDAGWHDNTSQTSRSICRASQSLVLWAQVVLHADAVDIQIYAGLPTVLGRFIDHHTFSVARKSCRDWAKGRDARLAVWLAANFLSSSLLDDSEGPLAQQPSHSGFDELLLHQWIQYLCALVIWAYSQALAPPKSSQRDATARFEDEESNTSGVTPPAELQLRGSHAALARRVPKVTTSLDKATREATLYLNQVLESNAEDAESFAPPHQYVTGVLELVEKVCRGSRWELCREASGVLRKLVRERNVAQHKDGED